MLDARLGQLGGVYVDGKAKSNGVFGKKTESLLIGVDESGSTKLVLALRTPIDGADRTLSRTSNSNFASCSAPRIISDLMFLLIFGFITIDNDLWSSIS